jgi:hypothetical protein
MSDIPTTLKEHVDWLAEKYAVSSASEAQSIGMLVQFYRDNIDRDPERTGELYKIHDHWERINTEVYRVITDGTNIVNGLFTEDGAKAYIEKQPVRTELPEFCQARLHRYEMIKIENQPLI